MQQRILSTSPLAWLLGSLILPALLNGKLIDDWQYVHPLPHNQGILKVLHEEGLYVSVGYNGLLTTSQDLDQWTTHFFTDMGTLDGLLYAEGSFLVTSRSGDILSSPDGKNWTRKATGTSEALLSGVYADGRYVLTGSNGVTATSTDGDTWTLSDTGDDNWYFGTAYGNGKYVAVSFDWDWEVTATIATSTNGVDWTMQALPAGSSDYVELYDVTYANGLFVASGYFYDTPTDTWGVYIASSADGENWVLANNLPYYDPQDDSTFSNPVYVNMTRYDEADGLWRAVGDRGVLMTSVDALNWTSIYPFSTNTADYFGIGFSHEGMVLVGARGRVDFLPDITGVWQQRFEGSYTSISDIAWNGSRYVTSGSIIMTSTDGSTWEGPFAGSPGGTLANVVYGQDRWVVGSRNNTSQIPLTTSTNGTEWAFPPTIPEGFTDCQDLAYGNGIFVALPQTGSNSLITSTDGLTWTGTSTTWFTDNQYRCYVTFDNGMFIAYSTANPTVEIITSTNGLDWSSPVDTGLTGGTYLDAAYGEGRWVLVGTGGAVATSTDLANWSEQTISFEGFEPETLYSVSYGKGHWVITSRRNFIFSSEDGVNWVSAFTNGQNTPGYALNSTIFDGLTFWAVGGDGVILQSGPLLGQASLSILPSPEAGSVRLQIEGDPGDRWEILYSPTLPATGWSTLTTIDLEGDIATHDDPVSGNRYYLLDPPGR